MKSSTLHSPTGTDWNHSDMKCFCHHHHCKQGKIRKIRKKYGKIWKNQTNQTTQEKWEKMEKAEEFKKK
jgi:G:T-mismatch repair DNA endonuclease (very short patch repair protein)